MHPRTEVGDSVSDAPNVLFHESVLLAVAFKTQILIAYAWGHAQSPERGVKQQ